MKANGIPHTHSPEYKTWSGMLRRCKYQSMDNFQWYGGSQIKVCPQWLGHDGFANFLRDMGPRPVGTKLYRMDCRKHYTPENCCWSAKPPAKHVRRNSHVLRIDGEAYSIAEWARRTNQKYATINKRLQRGYSPRAAVFSRRNRAATRRAA
jgi:hypothetical protein